MTRTLRTALVLSMAAHLALLALRLDREPPAEGELVSLDVSLDVTTGARVESRATPTPEAADAPAAEPPSEAPPTERPPQAPETLVAEQTTLPAAEETPTPAEPQPSADPAPRAPEPPPAPPAVETLAEAADGPSSPTAPERPVVAEQALRTIAPRPAPARDPAADAPTAPSAPATVAFSAREERMLDRKVEQWSATFHRMDPADPTVTWTHRGQEYTATFEPVSAEDDRGIDQLLVEITKEADGRTLSTALRLKKLAFSSFAQFVDEWDPRVQMHDDEIEGRFHSNSEVSLAFDSRVGPVFHGKVTTSSRGINTDGARGGRGRDEMFLDGLETGVRQISLPRELVPYPGDVAAEQLHFFEADTRLTFYPNGTFAYGPLEPAGTETVVAIGDRSAYLIAAPKAALHVKGVVNGSVLVYSPTRIVIENDLIYASDPETDPESDDYLGLVSDRYVTVASSKTTGPGDLVVHASIYAKRRFSVGRFRSNGDGALIIYGSLTAGSISATEPRYRTKIRFDPRLAETRAPSFPTTDRYEVTAWDSRWAMR